MRLTKLICTIGPASVGRLPDLVAAGMDVARVNFSHGNPETWKAAVAAIRHASDNAGRAVGVMGDLPGPKIRLGPLAEGQAVLRAGDRFALRSGGVAGDAGGASTTHPALAKDLRPGDPVFLADGAAELRVLRMDGAVYTEVVRGGAIRSGAGVNVPAERFSLPAVTDKDMECARLALELGMDFIAQSFVRSAADVAELRGLLGRVAPPIVAKIETRPAVEACREIAGAADAIMVARGDLGVEIPLEKVPLVQKDLIRAAGEACVPAIVATQMLESMTRAARPTRAEAGDVANAVLDGADAVLLSAETAIGDFPVAAAETAARIAETAEREGAAYMTAAAPLRGGGEAAAVANAAAAVARTAPAVAAIACYTQSGLTARLLSAARPGVTIFAYSNDASVVRRLGLWHGVRAFESELPTDTDGAIGMMDRRLRASGLLAAGSAVILVASIPVGQAKTNLLKMHVLSDWPG